MPDSTYCLENISDYCELLNCLFGFNGSIDPAPLGFGRDEIEHLSSTASGEYCYNILIEAVEIDLIPDFRDDPPPPPIEPPDPGAGGGGSTTADKLPVIPLGVLLWLITT